MSADLRAAVPDTSSPASHAELGTITATFNIRAAADVPVVDDVRAILASRYLEPRRVRTHCYAGTAVVTVEQPGTNEAEANVVLGEVRSLAWVQSAELECRLERRPSPQLQVALSQVRSVLEEVRIDVV